MTDVQAVGLTDLLTALAALATTEPLTQTLLRAGPCTCCVIMDADRQRVVGAVLHGKPGVELPRFELRRRRRARVTAQLDLFAGVV